MPFRGVAAVRDAAHTGTDALGSLVGTVDSHTCLVAFEVQADHRSISHADHGFEVMLPMRANLTEEYGRLGDKVAACAQLPSGRIPLHQTRQ